MSADKRSVSTDALETLGTIIDEKAGRDAIHIAVEPVEAMVKLYPGQDIGLSDGKAVHILPHDIHTKPLGIVDPFLKAPVQPGERFWMLIYPRQITSLRHVWTHPDVPDTPEYRSKDDREASEAWMREFINSRDLPRYETMLSVASAGGTSDGYLCFGENAYGDIPPEFWHHVEVITGKKIPKEQRASYFSCAC